MKKLSLAIMFALVVCSAVFVLAKEPVAEAKNPKSLEGKTWTITGWDVSTKQGSLKFELSLVIDKITGTGKKVTVHGLYISQESNQRKPEVLNFESPITAAKDGLRFRFKTTQGENMDAQITSDGACRLNGPLGVATLKPASR